jgi:hypothetical protein
MVRSTHKTYPHITYTHSIYTQFILTLQNYYRQREKPRERLGAGAKRLGKVTSEGWSVAGVPAGLSEARGELIFSDILGKDSKVHAVFVAHIKNDSYFM